MFNTIHQIQQYKMVVYNYAEHPTGVKCCMIYCDFSTILTNDNINSTSFVHTPEHKPADKTKLSR